MENLLTFQIKDPVERKAMEKQFQIERAETNYIIMKFAE